jgi:hypothetical protein
VEGLELDAPAAASKLSSWNITPQDKQGDACDDKVERV